MAEEMHTQEDYDEAIRAWAADEQAVTERVARSGYGAEDQRRTEERGRELDAEIARREAAGEVFFPRA